MARFEYHVFSIDDASRAPRPWHCSVNGIVLARHSTLDSAIAFATSLAALDEASHSEAVVLLDETLRQPPNDRYAQIAA
ncbi:MAG TPA: hypothetical protein VND91_09820 [Candidatus Saccharimonadia bacterium]|nr:hypothetical protein [Candidatus Saccharimonadia bacterium]